MGNSTANCSVRVARIGAQRTGGKVLMLGGTQLEELFRYYVSHSTPDVQEQWCSKREHTSNTIIFPVKFTALLYRTVLAV